MEAPNAKIIIIVSAAVTKNASKSICLGVQDTAGASIIILITQAADTKFINTYPTSLLTPIYKFLSFLLSDLKTKSN